MATMKRQKTSYPGVFFLEGKSKINGKTERIYYIRYRKDGKPIEEKAGRQFQDDMTPARANALRGLRIKNKSLTNEEKREKIRDEADKWTIARLWESYKINKPGLKGIVTDENRFNNHIQPALADKMPEELLPLDIDRLRLRLLKTKSRRQKKNPSKINPGTVKNVLELLRRIINYGVKKNLCKGINFIIEMPKTDSEKTEDLLPDQLKNLLKAIDESENPIASGMMLMALYSGIRRGEMFKLRWQDIDYANGFIFLYDPKGGKGQKIPLNESARQMLDNLPQTSEYVFPGHNGQQRTDIRKPVNRIKKAAGLPKDFRPLHGLRHTYASMLASSGKVDLYTLQKLLTHKSPAMTMRYAHLRDESLKKASNLAGNIIDQAVNEKKKVVNMKK